MPALVPGARFEPNQVSAGPLVADRVNDPPLTTASRVVAAALVRDSRGVGDLHIWVGVGERPGGCAGIAGPCEVRTQPDGTVIRVVAMPPNPDGKGYRLFSAQVVRGRSFVYVEATDSDRQGPGYPRATRDAPVLTIEQVLDLAVRPDLFLF